MRSYDVVMLRDSGIQGTMYSFHLVSVSGLSSL